MRLSSAIRAALIALTVTGAGLATAAYADSGTIRFNVLKAGFVVGGSAGSGTLVFHGRLYPLAIGGGGYGFSFWGSMNRFICAVSHNPRAADLNCVSAARAAGAAPRARARRRGWRDRAAHSDRGGAHAVGPPGRTDRRRRPQRVGNLAAVASPAPHSMPPSSNTRTCAFGCASGRW